MIRGEVFTRATLKRSPAHRRLKGIAADLFEKYPAAQRVLIAQRGGPHGRAGSVHPEHPTDIVYVEKTWGKREVIRLGTGVGPTLSAIHAEQRDKAYAILIARGLIQQLAVEILNGQISDAVATLAVCNDLIEEAGFADACVDLPWMIRHAVRAFEDAAGL